MTNTIEPITDAELARARDATVLGKDLTERELHQRWFWASWRGLESQGFKQSKSKSEGCLNNGPGGRHCAVGWLLENGTEDDGPCDVADRGGLFGAPNDDYTAARLLVEMRECHDNAASFRGVKRDLTRLAKAYGLRVPPPR